MANIKVAVRVRPISERELNFTGSKIVVHAQSNEISLTNLKVSSWKTGDSRERTKTYGFDYCFDSSNPGTENYATQAKIYETLGESALNSLFSGYNACLVAYGQSSSGKTYTMMGTKDDPGLTPRLCKGLFARIVQEEKIDKTYQASVSYLEIYNERVRDLLKPTSSVSGLKVREHPRLGPYVQGLTRHTVCNLGSLMSYVEEGTKARKTASTLQNPSSSRSHALLTVSLSPISQNGHSVTTSGKEKDFHRGSKLHLVDLAGSESAATCSGIHRLKEGANINKSLVALGNVISALAERGSSGNAPGRRFIPYRDSSLTWLLKDALGGNATTIMLATISPASGSYNETAHTLRFAQRAQSVVNRPVVNEDPIARIIRELRSEVARLKSLLLEKNLEGIVKPLCSCKQYSDQEVEKQDQKDLQVVPFSQIPSTFNLGKPKEFIGLSLRKYNSNESLVTRDPRALNSIRRFGSFESISPSESFANEARSNRFGVSELHDYEVNEPVFVDIPTLVAVLIKPDDTPQEHSTQIEEICSDGILEGSIDTEFLEGSDDNQIQDTLSSKDEVPRDKKGGSLNTELVRTSKNDTKNCTNTIPFCKDPKKIRANCLGTEDTSKEKVKLKKQDSIDVPSKKLNNLQISRAFGSAERLSKKREAPSLIERSHTNLERRTNSEKLKKLKNIKEVEDRRTSSRIGGFWRGLGASSSKDLQRKGSNDSDKSLKESAFLHKTKNPLRKFSIDDLKRKTSKDSSSSSSKEDQLISGLAKHTYSRKGSLQEIGSDQESSGRAHTPIQRIRRAEIVAAVTERLYSSGKKSEEGTGATTPASDYRSPESTDVKLAAVTRMRLQEISRRMLAKRRKISVDTQTDNAQTVRVRDSASLTEEPKIEQKDAEVLTDQHEVYENLADSRIPVLRVKEMATLTEKRKPPTVRCKDAGNITDDCDEDFDLHSPRNDSGILSDDTQNYADSNISSAETLDFVDHERRNVESSTNTARFSEGVNCSAQTRKEDLVKPKCSYCERQCCSRVHECCYSQGHSCYQSHNQNHSHNQSQNLSSSEKSVISISLPDMINITIESPNILESRISVVDEENLRTRFRDCEVQTDEKSALERGTSTDDINHRVFFNDFVVKTKPNTSQTDGKTFRIENIFQEPKITRNYSRIEIVPNLGEDPSLRNIVFTNSVGTSIDQPSKESEAGMRSRTLDFQSPLKTLRRRLSFIRERSITDAYNLRRRSRSFSPNRRTRSVFQSRYPSSEMIQRLNPVQEVFLERARTGYLIPSSSRTPPSFENRFSNLTKPFEKYFTTSKGEVNFFDGRELQTSRLDEFLIPKEFENSEVKKTDPYFSDDSLDLMEERADDDAENERETKVEEKNICQPDVVAHTKKESSNHDAESLLSSDENLEPIESNTNFKKKKVSFSTPSIIEVETQNLADSKIALIPKSIIKKKSQDSDSNPLETGQDTNQERFNSQEKLDDSRSFLENQNQSESLESSNNLLEDFKSEQQDSSRDQQISSINEQNLGRDHQNFNRNEQNSSKSQQKSTSNQRNIFKNYLDEAVTFIRNVNSMNDYISATNFLEKHLRSTRPPRRLLSRNRNYVEYAGQRVSLKDDTDQYLNDEEIEMPTKAYQKCLRGIENLEQCIGKVKDHEGFLKEKYGIGVEPAGAKFDLATSNQDSMGDLDYQYNDDVDNIVDSDLERNLVKNIDAYLNANFKSQIGTSIAAYLGTNLDNNLDTRIYDHLNKRSSSLKTPKSFSSYSKVPTKNDLTARDFEDYLEDSDFGDVRNGSGLSKIDRIKTPDCFLSVPRRGNFFSKRWKSPASFRHSSLPRLTSSSNESFSSSETIAASSESVDSISNLRENMKYPGSPRARFLQLLNERRRIVENSRKVSKF